MNLDQSEKFIPIDDHWPNHKDDFDELRQISAVKQI